MSVSGVVESWYDVDMPHHASKSLAHSEHYSPLPAIEVNDYSK